MPENPLEAVIRGEIQSSGPISISRYMELCLSHPEHGYYRNRDPLGAAGDFVTAPEISQVFGELIGLWTMDCWDKLGRPSGLKIVELGPGRGTLMQDALRSFALLPDMPVDIYMVETSPVLRSLQQEKLKATWVESVADIPAGPAIFIANEFFDALPVDQFIFEEGRWHELAIAVESGKLVRQTGPVAPDVNFQAESGDVREVSPSSRSMLSDISKRLTDAGGAALIIDYGYAEPAAGDSLQALKQGEYYDPFATPGTCDLTCHVDFSALKAAAEDAGAIVFGPAPQGQFLEALGAFSRADTLKQSASPDQRREIEIAIHRLTAPDQMGTLFKAMAVTSLGMAAPAGFDQSNST